MWLMLIGKGEWDENTSVKQQEKNIMQINSLRRMADEKGEKKCRKFSSRKSLAHQSSSDFTTLQHSSLTNYTRVLEVSSGPILHRQPTQASTR